MFILAFSSDNLCMAINYPESINQASPVEDIKVNYSLVYKGNVDSKGNINEDGLSLVENTGKGNITISFSESGNSTIRLVFEDNNHNSQETLIFENTIIGFNINNVVTDFLGIGIDWNESSIDLCTPNYRLFISQNVCVIAEANNCKLKPKGIVWELTSDPLITPILSIEFKNSNSLDKIYEELIKRNNNN